LPSSSIINKILSKKNSTGEDFISIIRKSSIAFFIKCSNAVISFAFNVILARLIGAEGAGVYYLAITISTIAVLFSSLGFNNVLLRYVSMYSETEDWRKVNGVIRKTLSISCLIAILISCILFFNSTFIADFFFSKEDMSVPIKLMSLAILPITIIALSQEILKGLEKYKEALIVGGLLVPLLGIPLLFLLVNSYNTEGAIMAFIASNFVTVGTAFYFINKHIPNFSLLKGDFDTNVIFAMSMPLFIMAITNFLIIGGDLFLLGIWEDNYNIGIYGAAKRLSILVGFILIAVNSVVTPKFAKFHAQGNIEALKNLAQKSTLLLVVLALPIVLFILFFPKLVMSILGSEFADGSIILIILALGQYINVSTGSVGYLLILSGYEKLMRNNIVFVSLLVFLSYILFIPTYGIMGAAIISALGLVLQNIIALFLVKKKLGFWVIPKLKVK